MNWFHDLFIEEAKPALERHSGGGEPINNQDKTITQNGTYIADEGFTGLGTVSVNVAREDQTDVVAQLDGTIDRSITEVSSNVTSVGGYVFYGCTSLTTANFPVVTSVGDNAFNRCSKLTTANFPVVTSVGYNAFNSCSALTSVDFPLANSIGEQAFYSCKTLASINFPVTTSVETNAFNGCSALTSVDFPMVKSVAGNVFYGCSKLTTVDFPVATSVGTGAFRGCYELSVLILRSETMCTLANTNVFQNTPIASGTGYIYVPRALVDTYKAATNWSTFATQFRALEDYTVDGTITGELDSTKI